MPGPAPKAPHPRQRTNRKVGSATLTAVASSRVPAIPNPDGREWHKLTRGWWRRVWTSPMASQYLESDLDGLARLAAVVDDFNRGPNTATLAEVRLQEARFGLSPLDRSRLQWEIQRAEKREPTRPKTAKRAGDDPRAVLMAVK